MVQTSLVGQNDDPGSVMQCFTYFRLTFKTTLQPYRKSILTTGLIPFSNTHYL